MATSGTTTFDLPIDEIIEESYERCGIRSMSGYHIKTARRSLNLVFLDWANRGLNLWTIEQRTLSLSAGDTTKALPSDTVNVISAVIRTGSGQTTQDIELDRISREEYLYLPDKYTRAKPAQYYVERTNSPLVYLYPTPDTSYTFLYYAVRRIQDSGAFVNTADVNFRFLPCLTAGLAYYLSLKFTPERTPTLKALYEEEFIRAAAEDRDIASLYFTPDLGP